MKYSIKAKFYGCDEECYYDVNNIYSEEWLPESKSDGTNITIFDSFEEAVKVSKKLVDPDFRQIWIEEIDDDDIELTLVYELDTFNY